MEVRELTPALEERWESFARAHPGATPFHALGWKRAVERAFGHRPAYLVALQGDRVRGILPAFVSPTLRLRRALVSTSFAVYGGICADDPEAARALLAAAERLGAERRVEYVELRNLEPLEGLPTKDLYATFWLELPDDPERLLASIPRKRRRMIRQGLKQGFRVLVGRDPEHVRAFHRVYAHSVRNLGSPVYPLRFFLELLGEFPQLQLLSVWDGDRMVAGVLTFFHRDRVLPYFGGALRPYFRRAVNDLMYWELMRYACEHGYRWFDFGRSKRGTGAFEFKRLWGIAPRPLFYQYVLLRARCIPDLSPLNPRFSPFIALWRRLPLPLARLLGPPLTRFLP